MKQSRLDLKLAAFAAFGISFVRLIAAAQDGVAPANDHAATDGNIVLAPYVWKRIDTDSSSRVEAAMPGAYIRATVQGTRSIELVVDGTANAGAPAAAMPIVDYSVDDGAFKSLQLSPRNEVYSLPLADGLDGGSAHDVAIYFRAGTLADRWASSKAHLRVVALRLSQGGSLLPRSRLPRNAIAFGDSITEGVLVEGPGPYYVNLALNNARCTWVPLACGALRCEYGQLGTGGQGMVRPIQMPPLPSTWDRYDALSSRLTNGLLLPEPDFVFCFMGTNDSKEVKAGVYSPLDIRGEYSKWLAVMRQACPRSAIFCITPPIGLHTPEIAAAVQSRTRAGDLNVYLIDTTIFRAKFADLPAGPEPGTYGVHVGATQLAVDGVHPSVYGNGMLGAFIAAEVERQLHARHADGDAIPAR